MFLVVGLGNPGAEYKNTYHNIGFMAADRLAEFFGGKFSKKKGNAEVCEVLYNGEKFVIAKSLSYMNNSGESVLKLLKYYKIDIKKLIVISDDIDLKKGDLRFRETGSGGTHNGLKNIVELLKTEEFKRIRIGTDRDGGDLANFVLSKISEDSLKQIKPAIELAVKKVLEVFNV